MGLVKKPNRPHWYYQCKVNGKTKCWSTGKTSKVDARKELPRLLRLAELLREQQESSPHLDQAIIAEVSWVEGAVSEAEAVRVDRALRNFRDYLGSNKELNTISKNELEGYVQRRIACSATATVRMELSYIVRMLRRNGLIVEKPRVQAGKVTRNRAFTSDELKRFFEHCSEEHLLLFQVMLATGARPAELIPSSRSRHVPLLKSELDVPTNIVHLRTAKLRAGQTAKERLIRIPEYLMKALSDHCSKTEGQFVFPSRNSSLKNTFDRILLRAGLAQRLEPEMDGKLGKIAKKDVHGRKLTAHSFRHTYATLMSGQVGNNPYILQAAMGHSQIRTTQQYCHPAPPDNVIDPAEWVMGVQDGCTKEKPVAEATG